ncbi:hypothetical protein [Sphingomonas sp.]|uniref:hypothetical protein n=1 Tax=Sphingomonas sp. TaxID=28214 RepID=UPI001B26CB1E|nr:hypothetical protein [Sphingomonas sp.]MBO9712797.1 hypothetical protein [Sphingomonas sp.]
MIETMLAMAAALTPLAGASEPFTTRWNMTPEQVIATMPNAVATPASPENAMRSLDALVYADLKDGDVALHIGFHFTRDAKPGLQLVNQKVTDRNQCAAYRDLLRARYGAGQETLGTAQMKDLQVPEVDIEWKGTLKGEHLLFVGYYFPGTTEFGLCKLIRTPKG